MTSAKQRSKVAVSSFGVGPAGAGESFKLEKLPQGIPGEGTDPSRAVFLSI